MGISKCCNWASKPSSLSAALSVHFLTSCIYIFKQDSRTCENKFMQIIAAIFKHLSKILMCSNQRIFESQFFLNQMIDLLQSYDLPPQNALAESPGTKRHLVNRERTLCTPLATTATRNLNCIHLALFRVEFFASFWGAQCQLELMFFASVLNRNRYSVGRVLGLIGLVIHIVTYGRVYFVLW